MSTTNRPMLSRRRFCLCCIAATTFTATGGWLTPREVFARSRNVVDMIREDAAGAKIKTTKLRDGIGVLEGSGGNIAVLSGQDGKVLIDAGITASRPQITEALASFGRAPVTHLINTHWHFDHADGNEWLNAQGATILAHENTRKHLSEAQRVEDWDFNFPKAPAGAIPSEVFSRDTTLQLNGASLAITHHPAAHTDGDIVVTLPDADVVHMGDLYWNGFFPFIDYSTGGSIDGMIAAARASLAAVGLGTLIIPGHGPVGGKAELQAFHDMLVVVRERVARLKQEGRSLAETIAAKPTEAFDARWGGFVIDGTVFTRLVYAGV